jgi:hypothetical protein
MEHFDAASARCRIFTFKEGILSAVAHDLEIDVGRFTVEIDRAARTADARFDATSLKVIAPTHLSSRDRATIEKTIVDEVLLARRWPEIRYRARATDERTLTGTLTLHGRERTIDCITDGATTAEAHIHQPDFGIKPYTAMLGTLRIKPDVIVRLTLTASR